MFPTLRSASGFSMQSLHQSKLCAVCFGICKGEVSTVGFSQYQFLHMNLKDIFLLTSKKAPTMNQPNNTDHSLSLRFRTGLSLSPSLLTPPPPPSPPFPPLSSALFFLSLSLFYKSPDFFLFTSFRRFHYNKEKLLFCIILFMQLILSNFFLKYFVYLTISIFNIFLLCSHISKTNKKG